MTISIGVLMLDTQFYRPVGDIGNPSTFSFPIVYNIVDGATVARVVRQHAETSLIDLFVQAAKELEKQGVDAITTSCGFLAVFQKEIQTQLLVPFYSSSLLQIPLIHVTSGGPIGVITASAANLTSKHLAGVDAYGYPLVLKGMDDRPAFTGAIIEESIPVDQSAVFQEVKHVTTDLIQEHPDLRSIVLECTNLSPYKAAIRQVTHLPIFDLNALMTYAYHTLE